MKHVSPLFVQRLWPIASVWLMFVLAAGPGCAQQTTVTNYVYDNNGRLRAVIAADGRAAVYDYDPAGNITAIRRLGAEGIELLTFFPDTGKWGDVVTFRGIGLHTVTEVSFNGRTARIVSAEPTRLLAEVPQGAITGPVTLISSRGTLVTSLPFNIRGVLVSPHMASVNPGQKRQFTARVLPDGSDQTVTWSVNGLVGGSSVVGIITATGEYTAPTALFSMITVRATSATDTDLSDDALVMVGITEDPARVTISVATMLSVGRQPMQSPATPIAANSSSISVGRAATIIPAPSGAAISIISVGRESAVTPPVAAGVISALLSVGREPQPPITTSVAVIGASLAVGRAPLTPAAVPVQIISNVVSASRAPVVTAVTPGNVARGASNILLTISGKNLNGAIALRFITTTGVADPNLTVTNLTASIDGTSITAMLAINGAAQPGSRLVIVTTPTGISQVYRITQNTIEITP